MKHSILIVDDRDQDIFLIKDAINKEYPSIFDIYEANDGEQALEVLKNMKIDICLVDINMPKMNGIKLLQELASRNIKSTYIMMTTSSSQQDIEDTKNHGAAAYMVKPVTTDTRRNSIKSIVSIFINKIFKYITV